KVDFSYPLHTWDGFGVNYVETSQTADYEKYPQDYGGFSILPEKDKQEILQKVFGADGLKVNIVKMFLDPFHQVQPKGAFDHQTTTTNLRYFAKEGKKIIEARDSEMKIITTLYGPPPFMNTINRLRGRDLDPAYKTELADYMINWVDYLVTEEKLPVQYLSLHNEGEDWGRMPFDGRKENISHQHLDYNLYWSPEMVVDYLNLLPEALTKRGLDNIKITPGEGTNWYRFSSMGYAKAIAENASALNNLGLITSHGFYNGTFWRLFSGTTNHGTWLLQRLRPELHAWTTSMSWMDSKIDFANLIYYHIYLARVNAIIPWAFIQRPMLWEKGDPNPGNAFTVFEDSTFATTRGYYFYKQMTQAGQPGMNVVYTESMDPSVYLLGFGANNTTNPDAFVLINNGYSFAGQTDALEIQMNINGDQKYYFLGYKEPVGTRGRNNEQAMKGVKFATQPTKTGYVLEAAFPWETLGSSPEDIKDIAMDFQLQSGAEDLENVVGWQSAEKLGATLGAVVFSPKLSEKGMRAYKTDNKISIDGEVETSWSEAKAVVVNHPRLQDANVELNGEIKIMYNDTHLYLLANVNDETNLKHKRLEIELPGTAYRQFKAYRTSYQGEQYEHVGTYNLKNGKLTIDSPGYSVTTFIGFK
ncbi:MAG: sugar-binding protein, partial [Candidatus Cyclobacteriaceae bacterium M3_2C_046]